MLSFSIVVVVVEEVDDKVASLSSVDCDDFSICWLVEVDFLKSTICLVTEGPVVGLEPVMGAKPDGVSARTVKCDVQGGPSGAARAS